MTIDHTADIPVPPASLATSDKALMILCHLSSILGVGLVLPFIVWLVKKSENDHVSAHAKEALNFHLSLLLYVLLCVPLAFIYIGIPIIMLIALGSLILAIVAAIKSSDGIFYRYPLTIRFFS